MQTKTKALYSAMLVAMASTYGVDAVDSSYTVAPSIEQTLMDKITESAAYLGRINTVPVDQLTGEKVIGSAQVIPGKRTDTDNNDREPSDILTLGSKTYTLHSTEYDVFIKYSRIDSWAKFPNFQDKYGEYVRKAIALSRIRTGWLGKTAAPVTDSQANPNGEDTNKGWFQVLREFNGGSQWLTEGGNSDEIRVGPGNGSDYVNIDSLVHDVYQLIDPIYRGAGDLVVYVGDDLVADEKARLYAAHGGTPSEKDREKIEASITVFAGLPRAQTPPFFPGTGVFITSEDNLSIYYQSGAVRRHQLNNPKRNRVEDYNSSNEGYVIEDENKAAGIEFANVKLHNGTSWA